ncbi:hypothetical protein E4T42_06188 [Aureobasidium subglaciale]|nr:hypothetical protein E4T42_06188 [Aureobasidium subglaciale]
MRQFEATQDWLRRLNFGPTDIDNSRQHRGKSKHAKIIAEFAKRGNLLARQIGLKLEQSGPSADLTPFDRSYIERPLRPIRGEITEYAQSISGRGTMSANDVAYLEEMSKRTPMFVYRAYTLVGSGCTNGLTTPSLYMPSASFIPDRKHRLDDIDVRQMHKSIYSIPLEVARPMVGGHLRWDDRIQDEFLSHTSSFLFGIVHLLLRHLEGQKDGYLSAINRTRAFRKVGWYKVQPENANDPGPVMFHHAPRYCDTIRLFTHDWSGQLAISSLHYRKFTHEYITHGLFGYPEDDELQPVSLETLVSLGLLDLVPALKIQCIERPSGLYTTLRAFRIENYEGKDHVKVTDAELAIAEKLAWAHMRSEVVTKEEKKRPHLWMLLQYLTLRKRVAGDELLRNRIRELGYTRNELDEGLHDGFETIPSNLPELHSLYHLATDVQFVVGGQPLNALALFSTYTQDPQAQQHMARADADYDRASVPSFTLSSLGWEIQQKCGLICDCNIWKKTKKRKTDHAPETDQPGEEGSHDTGGNDGDEDNDRKRPAEVLERTAKRPRTFGRSSDFEREVQSEGSTSLEEGHSRSATSLSL